MNNDDLCDLVNKIAKNKDREAFSALFEYFAPRLKAFSVKRGSSSAEADEVVQESMISVWRRAASYDGHKANVSTWIFAILRNKRIDLLRREKYSTCEYDDVELPPADTPDMLEELDAARSSEALKRELQHLPAEQLLLIRKAFFEEKSHSALAEELGIPLGTIKSRIRLALDRLRKTSLVEYA